MGDGFTVDSAEVRAHAGVIEQYGAQADVAAEAGAHLATLNDAYGLFCQSFGQMTVEPQQRGADALAKSAQNLHDLSQQVTEVAEAYADVEEKIATIMQTIVEQLDLIRVPTVGGR